MSHFVAEDDRYSLEAIGPEIGAVSQLWVEGDILGSLCMEADAAPIARNDLRGN